MNIVVISHSSVVGFYQHKFSLMARRYGDDITLITPPSWQEGGREVEAVTDLYPDIRVTPLPVHWRNRLNRHAYPVRVLRKYLIDRKPDIVYVEEEPRSLCAYEISLLCRRLRIPFIFYPWANIDRRYMPVNEYFMKRVCRRSAGAVAGSWEASEILRKRSYRQPVIIQPQYGIDPAFFTRRETPQFRDGWRIEGPVIAYAGRLVPEKGVDTLLRAFETLSMPATCVIAGSGPEFGALKQFAARSRRARDIYFLGSVSYDHMPELLSAFDILVLPSRTTPKWKEQFGRVLIEAMACGVCVVGSDSGAIPAVIGSAGWVFRENNIAALSKILSDLAVDADERKRLAEDGRARVLEHYTNELLSQRLREFFTRIPAQK